MVPFSYKMKYRIITLFPEAFTSYLSASIIKRAIDKKMIEVEFINLRDFGLGKRKQVDDSPYGGGPGMVIRVDVMAAAITAAKKGWSRAKVVLLTPQGETFNQKKAKRLADKGQDLILICGHYEGFDQRIRPLVDEEISIGNYVLTGGEIPAMAMIDSISRLLPNVLGTTESMDDESFSDENLLEYPQYTRPEIWKSQKVPEILLSGNHQEIAAWRKKMKKTKE